MNPSNFVNPLTVQQLDDCYESDILAFFNIMSTNRYLHICYHLMIYTIKLWEMKIFFDRFLSYISIESDVLCGLSKLTIEDVDEGDRHDQDAHQHVRHGQGPQEEVGGVLELLLQ